MRRRARLGLIVAATLVLMACATFQQNTYRTLYTAGTTYDTAMSTVSALQKANYINADQRKEINNLANLFYVSYHASVDAFEAYKLSDTSSNKDKTIKAITVMLSKWRDLAAAVNRLRPGTLPPELEEVK